MWREMLQIQAITASYAQINDTRSEASIQKRQAGAQYGASQIPSASAPGLIILNDEKYICLST